MREAAVYPIVAAPARPPRPVPPGPDIPAQRPTAPLDHHEHMRILAAANQAKRAYPGPIGELISIELLAWNEFGYRLGGQSLIARVVDDVMRPPRQSANSHPPSP